MQFQEEARRNKILGIWSTELMGKTDDDSENYAREVTKPDFEEAGDKDVYYKLFANMRPCSDEISIRTQTINLMFEVKA